MKSESNLQTSAVYAEPSEVFNMEAALANIPGLPTIGAVVTGQVVQKLKSSFLISIGQKSDCIVFDAEENELVLGETYQFVVEDETDEEGILILSRRKVASRLAKQAAEETREAAWSSVLSAQRNDQIIQANVHIDPAVFIAQSKKTGFVGGFNVLAAGQLKSFIPRRELIVHGDLQSFAGKTIPVKVLTADRRTGEIVLSHAKAIEQMQAERFASVKLGEVLDGTVVHVLESGEGALVDVGGELTGLVYRTEVAGDRNANPKNVLTVGDKVRVKVTEVNANRRSISLSIRQAAQEAYLINVHENDIVTGVVARFESYGTFVCLGGCIDGLLHNVDAKVDGGGRRERLVVNQEVRVRVLKIDRERQVDRIHISLSRKGVSD